MHAQDVEYFATSASRERLYAASVLLSVAPLVVLLIVQSGFAARRGASSRGIIAAPVAASILASPFWLW
jgi:hypothetical protein